jgi:hypothetical protein
MGDFLYDGSCKEIIIPAALAGLLSGKLTQIELLG